MARKAKHKWETERRSLDELLDAAVAIIDPPVGKRERCRLWVGEYVRKLKRPGSKQGFVHYTNKDIVAGLTNYVEPLCRAQKAAERFYPIATTCGFLEYSLPKEIRAIEDLIEQIESLPK